MTQDILREIGEALYGPRWQSDIARDLGVADRTVRRWLASANALPPGIASDLRRLCDERMAQIATVSERLKIAGAP